MGDKPGIMIDRVQMVFCARHLEPYRRHWPAGYAPALMCLVYQALNHDEEIIAATGGEIERVNAVLQEYGPLCCRNSEEMLAEIAEAFIQNEDKERWHATLRKYGPPPPGGWKEPV